MGSRPRNQWGRDNPYDLTAFIPAHAESQLNAEWQTSGNDILDDTVTVSSAVAAYTISRVVGSPDEIRAEMARQQVRLPFDPVPGGNPIVGMVPVHSAVNHGNAGTTTDFTAETVNIPMGAFLKRIAFVTQDATVVRTLRTQDGVTRLAITSPSTTEDIFRARLQHQLSLLPYGSNLVANAGAANSVDAELSTDFDAHAPFGIHAIDMRQFAQNIPGEDYGIDLRGFKTGDLVVGLYITTFASGDDTLFLFERYQPYRGALN